MLERNEILRKQNWKNLGVSIVLGEKLQMTPRSVAWVIDGQYCPAFIERTGLGRRCV